MNNEKRINQIEPIISKSDAEAVYKYLLSGGWVTEHNVTRNFENLISKKINREYITAVPNGTIAIYLALIGSGIKPGQKVAVPNLTMIATINAVLWVGAEPVLIDVNNDYCMSIEDLEGIKGLSGVIYVPLNGRTTEGLKIQEWCRKKEIVLIEDSAHALGSSYSDGTMCGKLGDVSIFSFTPHKIITTGQGGTIMTDNVGIYNEIEKLKTFNRKKDKLDWHEGYGLNFKWTDLQATLGISQLNKLEDKISRKLEILNLYKKINSKVANLHNFAKYEVPWFFDLYFNSEADKTNVQNLLKKNNIETRDLYPPLSMQEYLSSIKKTKQNKSENTANKSLWLPSSVSLLNAEVEKIVDLINSYSG